MDDQRIVETTREGDLMKSQMFCSGAVVMDEPGVDSVQEIHGKPTLLLVQIGRECEVTTEEYHKLQERIRGQLPGVNVLIFPPGLTVRAVPSGAAFYREQMGDYSIEMFAESSEALERLMDRCGVNKKQEAP